MTKPVLNGSAYRPEWRALWSSAAKLIAERSLCVRARVGAVIVDPDERIISTGYNGPPAGFQHDDRPCLEWCARARKSSPECGRYEIHPPHEQRDSSSPCGGWPRAFPNLPPDYSDCPSLHAEANALLAADRSTWQGGTIYVLGDVCSACAKLIANSGLARLVVVDDGVDRSYRRSAASYVFLLECGIEVFKQ